MICRNNPQLLDLKKGVEDLLAKGARLSSETYGFWSRDVLRESLQVLLKIAMHQAKGLSLCTVQDGVTLETTVSADGNVTARKTFPSCVGSQGAVHTKEPEIEVFKPFKNFSLGQESAADPGQAPSPVLISKESTSSCEVVFLADDKASTLAQSTLVGELEPSFSKEAACYTRCDCVVVGMNKQTQHLIELKYHPTHTTMKKVCENLVHQIIDMVTKEHTLRTQDASRAPIAVSVIIATHQMGAGDSLVKGLFVADKLHDYLKKIGVVVNLVIIEIPEVVIMPSNSKDSPHDCTL
jgi:hypothetical protein